MVDCRAKDDAIFWWFRQLIKWPKTPGYHSKCFLKLISWFNWTKCSRMHSIKETTFIEMPAVVWFVHEDVCVSLVITNMAVMLIKFYVKIWLPHKIASVKTSLICLIFFSLIFSKERLLYSTFVWCHKPGQTQTALVSNPTDVTAAVLLLATELWLYGFLGSTKYWTNTLHYKVLSTTQSARACIQLTPMCGENQVVRLDYLTAASKWGIV